MPYSLTSIGYFISGKGGATAPHIIHEGTLLFELILKGTVIDPINDSACEPGTVFAHHPGEKTVHVCRPDEHYECMTAYFDCEHPEDVFIPSRFFWDDVRNRNTFCHEMLHSYHYAEMDKKTLGDLVWSQFSYRLEKHLKEADREDISSRLKKVIHTIEQHFAEDLTIQDLADQVQISPSHLHAEFKQAMNSTPHQYLIVQRMKESRHRLVTTNEPIKAIAAQVGYSNTENFCRAFKTHFNRTAADYRKTFSFRQILQ